MYPLQTLFEIRERAKKDSEEVYAKEKHKLNEAEKRLKEMQEELQKMRTFRLQKRDEYFEAINSQKLTIEKIKINQCHLDGLLVQENAFVLEINQQEQLVMIARQRVQKALDVMMQATEAFKVLEKQKEKWTLKQKKEREQKEESESDDITQARYNIQHKESHS